jgi:MEMO1 family protein
MDLLKNNFAGSFYAKSPIVLNKQIDTYLSSSQKTISNIKGLIVPHAGYAYSGKTAGYGYKQLENEIIDTIIILAPAHKNFHQGLALPIERQAETPLGNLLIDQEKVNHLVSTNFFTKNSSVFYQEHSLEVQLPFIKKILPNCSIVPINVGVTDYLLLQESAIEIAKIIDDKTVIVVSNDLSHYHSLNKSKLLDEYTIEKILEMSSSNFWSSYQKKEIECCGFFPIVLLLETLKEIQVNNSKLIYYETSASVSFDQEHVVGYASIAFY